MNKLEEKYTKIIPEGFTLKSIDRVNHRPHPYTIGAKHVAYAADHCGGILGESVTRKIPCAHRGCRLSYDQHTSDQVMFLSLTRNMSQDAAREKLKVIVDAGMESDGIDGFAFVKSEFDFTTEV